MFYLARGVHATTLVDSTQESHRMPARHTRLIRLALGVVLILIASARPADAFESREHQRLSNIAFAFALDIHCRGADTAATDCEKLRPLLAEGPMSLSYGDVVRCVDFFLTPEKMIAGRENDLFSSRVPANPAPIQDILPQTSADYTEVDFTHHCTDSITNLAATQAAHSNHAHFQAELMASQALYHRLAIQLRREGRTFAALFVNGISDHYLQDFFAPGHVGTFRSHMSDIYSNALHDSINHGGAHLRFARADYEALVASIAATPSGQTVDLSAIGLDASIKTRLSCLPDQSRLDNFIRETPADICSGDEPSPAQIAWLERVANLAQLLELPINTTKSDRLAIPMVGDNELWRPAQQRQRVLMLALQLRSILDVLRAPAGATSNNWFVDGHWNSYHLPDGAGAVISASIDGRFRFDLRFLRAGRQRAIQMQAIEAEGKEDVVKIAEIHDHVLRLVPSGTREVVLSAGLNYEVPHFGSVRSRTSISFETPVLAFLTLGDSKINFGAAAGAFSFREDGNWRSGISLRPGIVASQSETFLSVPLRWFRYEMDGGRKAWRRSWGLRLDQGFSSFSTVYLQISNSPFQQDGMRIERGQVFGAGVVLAAPLCRIPKVAAWFC
jgi:hypothetical protein